LALFSQIVLSHCSRPGLSRLLEVTVSTPDAMDMSYGPLTPESAYAPRTPRSIAALSEGPLTPGSAYAPRTPRSIAALSEGPLTPWSAFHQRTPSSAAALNDRTWAAGSARGPRTPGSVSARAVHFRFPDVGSDSPTEFHAVSRLSRGKSFLGEALKQGCQLFLGPNIQMREKIYQMTQPIPNGHKI
jgi:hypothetical protein